MAAAVQNGIPVIDGLWWSDCAKCGVPAAVHEYQDMSLAAARQKLPDYRHAAHAMIYAIDDRILFNKYKATANIMMQIRFDGLLGFPGGFIDDTDESVVDGLNRELDEEVHLDMAKHRVTEKDHVVSYVCPHKKLVTHFYAIEVTVPQYEDIERRVLAAHDWGSEVLGITRVPLHTMDNGKAGLPLFLASKFVGNARKQLITAIQQRQILPTDYIERTVNRAKELSSVTS